MRANFREAGIIRGPKATAIHAEMDKRDTLPWSDAVRSKDSAHLSPRRALLRPFNLGLLCLVLSVVLWGLGYKLSLYRPHPSTTARTRVAKLWVNRRDDRAIVSVRLSSTGHSIIDPHSLFALSFPSNGCRDAASNYLGASIGKARIRLLLGTLRSPPRVIST
jgi:hypothetical protein